MAARTVWPLSTIAGPAAIVVYLSLSVVSYLLYPGPFGPLTNWLSDLGSSALNPSGATFYRLAAILGGTALFFFYLGFSAWNTGEPRLHTMLQVTRVVGVFSTVAFVMTGVFTIDDQPAHSLWSAIFYATIGFFLIISSITLIKRRPGFIKPIGYYGLVSASVNFVFAAVLNTFLLQWVAVTMFIAYLFLLSYNLNRLNIVATPSSGRMRVGN